MTRALSLLILILVVGPTCALAQGTLDDFTRAVYAGLEESVHREYNIALMSMRAHDRETGADRAQTETMQQVLKVMFYNRSALFAYCGAEAEKARAPDAPRVPAEDNPVLTSCVEQKFGELNDFSNKLNYAGVFFPERIKKCGEASRLPERERLLPPYEFLRLAEPKLYDFAHYNRCLMTSD